MEEDKEVELNKRYRALVEHHAETNRLANNINALLPESIRLNVQTFEEKWSELIQAAREKAVRAVLAQYAGTNVDIDIKGICAELDKTGKGYFDAREVKVFFGAHWEGSKDLVKKELYKGEVSWLMPRKAETVDQFVKNRCLVLRHQVTECKYGGSPDGLWQFESRVENLEKLIRIHAQRADPRTVEGHLLRDSYNENKADPWYKRTFSLDPIFLSSRLYKNGKFELELASGEMARSVAAFLFELDRECRV